MALMIWIVFLIIVWFAMLKLKRTALGWATLAGWLTFPVYNYMILSSCPGDCGIRVDLLLVAMLLLPLTFTWLVKFLLKMWRKNDGPRM
jgi:hypothetical protein